jgi:LPXTG-motif cell wall-anchored protein
VSYCILGVVVIGLAAMWIARRRRRRRAMGD